MVDIGRVRSLLDRILGELGDLRRLAALSDDELIMDPDKMAAVKYRMVVSVEAAIDVAEHVIASEGWPAPDSFAEAFATLGTKGWLSERLSLAMQDAARFRNLLVHGYAEVDDERVREILRENLEDLSEFTRAMAAAVSDRSE